MAKIDGFRIILVAGRVVDGTPPSVSPDYVSAIEVWADPSLDTLTELRFRLGRLYAEVIENIQRGVDGKIEQDLG